MEDLVQTWSKNTYFTLLEFHQLRVVKDDFTVTILPGTIFPRNYFSHRAVNVWISLPESLTLSAPSVNCFKSRLEALWKH
jgi:hypothetical protein